MTELGEPYGGSIELIIGPMYGEKSAELLSRARRAAYANHPVVLVKHQKDTRYSQDAIVSTHAEMRQGTEAGSDTAAPIRVVTAATLAEVSNELNELVVGIDEGQFFDDLLEYCERWANEGRRVIVAALDGTFARKPFGQACDLIPLCEKVTKFRGVCMRCRRRDSAFTLRLGDNTEVVDIGGRDKYLSVCRRCYFTGR